MLVPLLRSGFDGAIDPRRIGRTEEVAAVQAGGDVVVETFQPHVGQPGREVDRAGCIWMLYGSK